MCKNCYLEIVLTIVFMFSLSGDIKTPTHFYKRWLVQCQPRISQMGVFNFFAGTEAITIEQWLNIKGNNSDKLNSIELHKIASFATSNHV